ncbi:MAG: methylenetetrahydrofolate reductase, partial [Caldimicrobium sp.]
MKTRFQELLERRDFVFTFELVPARSVRTRRYQEILKFLLESQKKNLFQAFSITDNAGGNPALSPIPLGKTIKNLGLEPIIHFSCKDKNRNQIESELLALDKEGLHNLLILTGDYPLQGYLGRAKPVYDLDSVLLLSMISDMERGFDERPAIPFFKGAVVNPFKLTLPEIWWQYLKLYKKLKAGAYFIITQVGFYPRKWLELKILFDSGITFIFSRFLEDKELHRPEEDKKFKNVPLLGSLLYLTPFLVKIIKEAKIPGILLTESILKRLEGASNFEETVLDIAARLAAILKGLGYNGIHLCGFPLDYSKIQLFFEKFSKYEASWEDYFEEFEGKA